MHILITEGVFTPRESLFLGRCLAASLLADSEERFRYLLLKRLHRPQRLSDTFLQKLLGWNPLACPFRPPQLTGLRRAPSAAYG
jgi:hypothetical protein